MYRRTHSALFGYSSGEGVPGQTFRFRKVIEKILSVPAPTIVAAAQK
jgi:hypothetical protein